MKKVRSNRTFMELKYANANAVKEDFSVLIVPLWNWNTETPAMIVLLPSSNRTFMELKYTQNQERWRDCEF